METGIDIVSLKRIDKAIHNKKFIERICTQKEIKNSPFAKANYYAKIFTLKEAISKALGTGIGGGVTFHQMEIDLKAGQKIKVNLNGKAHELTGTREVLLSVTKSRDKVIGFVVIS